MEERILEWLDQQPEPVQEEMSEGNAGYTELVRNMQRVLASLFHQYLQYKHHHWLTSGIIFRDVHLMFDEATDETLEFIDDLGERIVAFGAIPITALPVIQERSVIQGLEQENRDTSEMLQQALKATKQLIADLKNVAEQASNLREFGVEQLAGDILVKLEKLQYKFQQFLNVFN